MSDFQRNPNQKPPNAMNEYALRLTGDPINGGKKSPLLMVNVKRDGKSGPWSVLFETRTGVENDKDYGKISFLLDMPTAFSILQLVNKHSDAGAAGAEADVDKVEIHARRFIRNQNAWSKEPMLEGTIAVGHTGTGQVYVGIKSWDNDRPQCKFLLKPVVDFRRATKFFKKDGTPWDEGPLSQFFARAWAEGIGKLLAILYSNDFTPPPPREDQGGGGGGYGGGQGGGNRQGGGGGYGGGGGNRGGGGYNNNNNQGGGSGGGGNPAPAAAGSAGGDWGDDIPM